MLVGRMETLMKYIMFQFPDWSMMIFCVRYSSAHVLPIHSYFPLINCSFFVHRCHTICWVLFSSLQPLTPVYSLVSISLLFCTFLTWKWSFPINFSPRRHVHSPFAIHFLFSPLSYKLISIQLNYYNMALLYIPTAKRKSFHLIVIKLFHYND